MSGLSRMPVLASFWLHSIMVTETTSMMDANTVRLPSDSSKFTEENEPQDALHLAQTQVESLAKFTFPL